MGQEELMQHGQKVRKAVLYGKVRHRKENGEALVMPVPQTSNDLAFPTYTIVFC